MLKTLALGVLVSAAAVMASGCSSSQGIADAFTTSDSAGIAITVTHRAEWEGVVEWSGDPHLRLPHSGGPALTAIWAAEALPDGSIVILDRHQNQGHLFSPDGEVSIEVGRPGRGPGEFVAPVTLEVIQNEGIRIFDRSLNRFTDFGPDGTLQSVFTIPRGDSPVRFAWLLQDERVLLWEARESGTMSVARSSRAERRITPGRLSVVDLMADTASVLFEGPAQEWIVEGGRWWITLFGPGSSMDFVKDRVFISPGHTHEVNVVHPDSGLVAIYRFPAADRPFDSGYLQRLETEGREEAQAGGFSFSAGAIFQPELQPATHPSFRRIRARENGAVWAQVHAPTFKHSSDWWLIDSSGRFRGIVRLPDRRDILGFAGDFALIESLDEFDVPTLEKWFIPDELR